jgi:PAS domain S-box-containing protein
MSNLRSMGGDVESALERVGVPSYVIDRHGIIRWVNPAAKRLVGDVRGRQFTSVVSAEETRRAKEAFARKISGIEKQTDQEVVVVDVEEGQPPLMHPHLTPRQTEVLRLLERGHSTNQIARELHLSTETVRNHVRHLLRALGVHSRLEAVATARRAHLIEA